MVDIRTGDGDTITAYCPATGRLRTCERVGAPVEYLPVVNSERSLKFDWWSIRMPDSWVVIDTRPANYFLKWHKTASWMPSKWSDAHWHPEPSLKNGDRLDYKLTTSDESETWIEIKSVTWCEDGIGFFPDAPSKRAVRHLEHLEALADRGADVYLVFVCMRSDICEIRPASSVDPNFSSRLGDAVSNGMNVMGIGSTVSDRLLQFTGTVPVEL